nr:hypothetical protein [Tanacetum cinerariifolium]
MYAARMTDNCTVADAIEGNDWKWPSDWYDKYPILKSVQVPVLDELIKDTIKWWKDLYVNGESVTWSFMVWYTQCIPKHAFVLWMAVQEKLLTQDRILKWKPNEILECALCGKCNDSHEHLFFQCTYSAREWGKLQPMINRKALELEGQC